MIMIIFIIIVIIAIIISIIIIIIIIIIIMIIIISSCCSISIIIIILLKCAPNVLNNYNDVRQTLYKHVASKYSLTLNTFYLRLLQSSLRFIHTSMVFTRF